MFTSKINVVKSNVDVNIYNDVFFDIVFDYKYFCFDVISIAKFVFDIDVFENIDVETNNDSFKNLMLILIILITSIKKIR